MRTALANVDHHDTSLYFHSAHLLETRPETCTRRYSRVYGYRYTAGTGAGRALSTHGFTHANAYSQMLTCSVQLVSTSSSYLDPYLQFCIYSTRAAAQARVRPKPAVTGGFGLA